MNTRYSSIYIKLEDNYNRTDIIKLTSIESNKTYTIYNVSTTNSTINNLSKDVKMSLFYFIGDGMKISDSFDISLDYTSFNFSSQFSVIKAIAADVAEKYNQIDELTKLNINLYKDILEVTGKE